MRVLVLIQGCRFAPADKHTPASKNISQNQVGKRRSHAKAKVNRLFLLPT